MTKPKQHTAKHTAKKGTSKRRKVKPPESPAERRERRLRMLAADLLLMPPERKFDQNEWGRHRGDHRPDPRKNYCGTAVCTLGNAALNPLFRKEGLRGRWQRIEGDWKLSITYRDPETNILCHEGDAGMAFFGLTYNEGEHLFGGDGNATTLSQAEKVIQVINENKECK